MSEITEDALLIKKNEGLTYGKDFMTEWCRNRLLNYNKNIVGAIVGDTGCQPAGSKVLLADGKWINIEHIKVGDIVISPQIDGTNIFAKVTDTFSFFSSENYGVYQKNRSKNKMYSCNWNHTIPVFYRKHPRVNGKRYGSINPIFEIRNYSARHLSNISSESMNHNRIGITSFKINNFNNNNNCSLNPYILGYYLGNGHFTKSSLGITTMFNEVVDYIQECFQIMNSNQKNNNKATTYFFSSKSRLAIEIKRLGLHNKTSGDKFIPQEALLSDSDYRLRLLAGLVDSDGTLNKSSSYSICTKSKQLAEDINNLVHSLGGRATINKIRKQIRKINFEGEYYNINFYLDEELPLLIYHKQKKILENKAYKHANQFAMELKKESPCIVYGFELESPSKFYITDNWAITHNSGKSYSAIRLAELVDPNFTVDNIVFTPQEFMKLLNSGKLQKGSAIIYEEPQTSISKREWYKVSNKLINYVLSTFRNLNLMLIFTCPDLTFIDGNSVKLFKILYETMSINQKEGLATVRPKIISVNHTMGKVYYKYLRVIIDGEVKVMDKLVLRKANRKILSEYEFKKKQFNEALNKKIEQDLAKLDGGTLHEQAKQEKILTNREEKMYDLLGQGYNLEQSAQILGIDYKTAANIKYNIKRKGLPIYDL